jgi:hypothetical protein
MEGVILDNIKKILNDNGYENIKIFSTDLPNTKDLI